MSSSSICTVIQPLPAASSSVGVRKGSSGVSEVDATHRMEQHRSTRCRLLSGFSGLARSRALLTADAASCRFANDRDLPEKKLDRPLLHRVHPHQATDPASERERGRSHSHTHTHTHTHVRGAIE